MFRNTLSHARHLRIVLFTVAAVIAVLAVGVASTSANAQKTRELFRGVPESAPPLVVGTTYRGSLVSTTPTVRPAVPGWIGAQLVSHQRRAVRYERAAFLWQQDPAGEIAIISGPAMTTSAAATVEQPRRRARYWKFDPYKPPTPVKRWNVAGHTAFYFDGTDPGPSAWTLVGSNPPDDQADPGQSFRLAGLTVRGQTVVILIKAPNADFARFLPIAQRLLASLKFAGS
jgi:hypothetical protein